MDIDMKYKVLFGFLIVLLFAGGIFIGYKINDMDTETNNALENEVVKPAEDVEIYDNSSVQTFSKTYDILLVYEDNYIDCGETVTKSETIYGTTLDELKEKEKLKQQEQGKVYMIKEEENTKLVFSRYIAQNCPNHFKAILEDNVINIYQVITEDKEELYKTLDTKDKLVRDDLKEELKEGVFLNSHEELNLFIEDLES